jgi:hypothetical protein
VLISALVAALPVVFTLLRTRKPELGTPALALSLRTSSIGLHVLAGVLIIGRDRDMLRNCDHVVAENFGALRHAELVRPGDGKLPGLEHRLDFHQVRQREGQLHICDT